MVDSVPLADRTPEKTPSALFAIGAGLIAYGSYMHLTIGDRTLGNCLESGACDPWHPTWVVAPLVVGTLSLVVAVVLARRR